MFRLLIALACLLGVLAIGETFEAKTNERITDLEAFIKELAGKNADLEKRLHFVETENEHIRQHLGLKESGLTNGKALTKRQFQAATVAFTAILTTPTLDNLQGGQVILYDKVITNVANGYDSSTGVFTAPTSGVYGFNFAMMSEPNTQEYLQIVKDGQYILNNFAHSSTISVYSSASRTVTLELQQGNKVWIQTPPAFSHGDGSIHGNEYTTFSGWLIAFTE